MIDNIPKKQCSICGGIFLLKDYHNDPSAKHGKKSQCPECRKKDAALYYKEKRSKIRKQQKGYYERNKDAILKKKREQYWRKKELEEEMEEKRENFTEYDDLPDLW